MKKPLNYYKDFKNERFHDNNLIELVTLLNNEKQLSLLENALDLNTGDCGYLVDARKKRDFDVLLEFENCCIIIETKVDSPEGHFSKKNQWQTDRIHDKYHKQWPNKKKVFVYLTYGLAEFYIKRRDNNDYVCGAHNPNFYHWKSEYFQHFLNNAIQILNIQDKRLILWNKWLQFEQQKRKDYKLYLRDISSIIERYKEGVGLTDYPVNRLNLFVPEFTIPFYYELACLLNKKGRVGKVGLYPIGRGYASTNDSVLNFKTLWEQENLSCGGLLNSKDLYFELNEDFNLHLKATMNVENIDDLRAFIEKNKQELSCDLNSTVEYYKQGAYVLYEWDLHLLMNTLETNVNMIENVILNAIEILT